MNISQDEFRKSLDKLLNEISMSPSRDALEFVENILLGIIKVQFNLDISLRKKTESIFDINRTDKKPQTSFLGRFTKAIDHICSSNDKINFIPSDKKVECRESCVVKITDDWKLNPSSKIRVNLTSYWLSCAFVNKKTLIISEAWIPTKFNTFKRDVIQPYEDAGHSVIFVTYDEEGYSLRYPKNR